MPPDEWEPFFDWEIIAPARIELDRLRNQISTAGQYTEMLDRELEALVGSYMEDDDQITRNRLTTPSENFSTVEPLAPWELELLQASTPQNEGPIAVPDVGTANAEQGGTPMPNGDIINIAIPITRDVLNAGFDALDARTQLVNDRSLENWNTVRVMFNDAVDVAGTYNHAVQRGRFDFGYPAIRIGGRNVEIDNLPYEFALNLVEVASDGRMTIERLEDRVFEVVPTNAIAKEAWYEFNGSSKVGSTNDAIRAYELRDILSNFDYFWKGSARRAVIKSVLAKRRSMERPVLRHNTAFTMDRSAKFGQFFEKVKANMRPVPSPFTLMPILPPLTLSSRRWGIEIEAVDIAGIDTPEGWELKDDGSLRGINNENSGYMAYHDSDCASHDESPDCDCGNCMNDCDCGYEEQDWSDNEETQTGEWNSPVLRSFHSRGLRYLCSQLENRETNQSPGIHVHVEASDLTPEQAFRLSVIYSSLEPLFESEYARTERHYCQSVDLAELVKRMNQVREVNANGGTATDMEFFSRYWAVNLASLSQHGTIEFRAMGPRYNYEHLTRWAQFCREMVNIAKADVPQREWAKVRTFQDVLVLFSKYGKETPTPTWAKNVPAKDVVAALGKELRRIPNVISHPDGVQDVFEAYYLKKDRLVPSVMNNNW